MMPLPTPAALSPWQQAEAWGFLVLTIALYFGAKRLYLKRPVLWLSPILVTPGVMLTLLVLLQVPYALYYHHTQWLTWLLGPATVAFALPIYQQRDLIRRYPLSIALGVVTGVVVGMASSWALSWLLNFPDGLMRSLMARSVSSPFAIPATLTFEGQPEMAVMCVLVTGVFGMLVGQGWLGWLQVREHVAVGSAFGAATHGVGTAKAYQLGQVQGAVSSLTMIFSGIVLVLVAPWVAPWLG
ncbi:LrgB family protein [Aquabacterium lacunae]|uniref:LrgB family protein n=1 Tax=Aquabacterium lacunae TaxID=2528630 RepID=A0A4Q9H361_9BURK|nr:LrgB family protein [Aquabacterium lacunae]TBO30114.1 LrgB family protein [Aquabacterium lacunae]